MTSYQKKIRWLTIIAIIIVVPASFLLGLKRIVVDADITSSIPRGDVVVDSAAKILGRHPALDLVTMDLHMDCNRDNVPQELSHAATYVEKKMKESGLFDRVGMDNAAQAMVELLDLLLEHLPQMFDSTQLARDISQRITPQAMELALQEQVKKLSGLQGVGQAHALSLDPLGFRDVVLSRMAALNPTKGAYLYNGQLLSADGCHLLILADPKKPGSDTVQAKKIIALLDDIQGQLDRDHQGGSRVEITAIGAFRSALDNENIVRADTKRALWIATLGVALLLLLCFPRPWLGLLALVPAVAGVGFALLIYSLVETSISALALGFGGALVTISVDHAIAYLQFLDRAKGITGRQASKEVWSVGLVAALTTVGAFLTLYLSGITMLGQVGLFAALGVGLSFLFVHLVFPLLFPEVKSSERKSILPIQTMLASITRGKSWIPVALAAVLTIGMLVLGSPGFSVDLRSMNTVSQNTIEAEQLVKNTWGDIFQRTYLLAQAPSIEKLRQRTDSLSDLMDKAKASGSIRSGFSPSMVLPGLRLGQEHIKAWKKFFTPERIQQISSHLKKYGTKLGFAQDAFDPFISSLARPEQKPIPIPEKLYEILGISHTKDGGWIWVGAVEPGDKYDSEALYKHAHAMGLAVFDPTMFSQHMSRLLASSFVRMLMIVSLAVLVLLIILFLDATLVGIAVLPLGFALVCTMGFMKLFNHPMDIPSLMLGVVILGMGVDYALYFVKAQQRYFKNENPSMGPIRVAVFLAATSTLVGLGTLAMAHHAVAHSAGFTTLLGIGFSLLGAFVILPPFLTRIFAPRSFPSLETKAGSRKHLRAVRKRYAHLEPSVRMFARFKLLLDPMFPKLAQLAGPAENIERVLDLGCGYALASSFLAAILPRAHFYALDPDVDRKRIAERVLGNRARVELASATTWDTSQDTFDLVLFLDVMHYLADKELKKALQMIRQSMRPGARLLIRANVPKRGRFAWERWMESARLRSRGLNPVFRTARQIEDALQKAGLEFQMTQAAAAGREETWFIATAPAEPKA